MMRRLFLGLAIAWGISAFTLSSQAQTVLNPFDPFFFYYGVYLPRQAALAAQPRVNDTINAAAAQRQVYAQTERSGLYDPIQPFGLEELDPSQPFTPQGRGGARRLSSGMRSATGVTNVNINGVGPPTYYGRAGAYFPGLREGHGPNSNLYSGSPIGRSRGRSGMGGGFF